MEDQNYEWGAGATTGTDYWNKPGTVVWTLVVLGLAVGIGITSAISKVDSILYGSPKIKTEQISQRDFKESKLKILTE